MAQQDMAKELAALRAQVAELASAREAQEKARAQAASERATELAAKESEETPSESTSLSSQLEELVDTLGEDIKEAKPATLLVVFALGVLLGRLLPR